MAKRMQVKRDQHAELKKNIANKRIKTLSIRKRIRELSTYYRNLALEIKAKKATGNLAKNLTGIVNFADMNFASPNLPDKTKEEISVQ